VDETTVIDQRYETSPYIFSDTDYIDTCNESVNYFVKFVNDVDQVFSFYGGNGFINKHLQDPHNVVFPAVVHTTHRLYRTLCLPLL
jgi:hypothetical protein